MEPVQTLHDFALTLLDDADAMAAFESDPTGVLQTAGLGDITAEDIHEILPLVADYSSDVGLAGTAAIAQDVIGNVGLGQDLDSDVLGEVANSGDLVHSVTGSLDLTHLNTGIDTVDDVTGAVHTGDLNLTDGLDLHTAVDDTIGDVTDNVVGNVTGNPVTTALHDVGTADLTGNLSDIHGVVDNVGLNGDVTHVVGDLDLGSIDLGGIGNGNDVDF